MKSGIKIAIIGGGASGFMAGITAKEINPNARVTIFEKTDKILLKLKLAEEGGVMLLMQPLAFHN